MKKVLFFIFIFLALPIFVFAEQIDINSATLSQLDELTGIGPVYAQRIIDNRPYSSIDDLDKVKGIGPKTLQKIKDQGFACINCETVVEIASSSPTPRNDEATPSPSATPTSTPAPPATPEIIYPAGIFINEILPSPKGADETDEWIELYNSNNFDVDLSGWKLQDTQGTPTAYTFPENHPSTSSGQAKITANGYLVLKRPDTKIMLNNTGDGLNLFWPNGKTADSMLYQNALTGQSYNKRNSEWLWSATLTPGAKNIFTEAVKTTATIKTPSASSGPNGLPKTEKSATNEAEAGLADSGFNPWFLFLIALALTIVSAIIVIIIKIYFKKHVRT